MLQIKLIEMIELLSVTDLLIIVKIIEKVNPDFMDEDFYDLFLQILEIKSSYINHLDLKVYMKNI